MRLATIQKLGGISLIAGSGLMAAYSVLFATLLPVSEARHDFTKLVASPHWIGLVLVALAGVLLMMLGLAAAYTRLYGEAGVAGLLGLLFVEVAYLLQGAKVTWELFLYPVIVRHEPSAALLRDRILLDSPGIVAFRMVASATILLGIVLFCLALVRSRAFPKSGGALIFFGALAYGLGPIVGIVPAIAGIFVLSAGCLVIGLRLIRPEAA
jgi:hypothetical protein